MTLLTMCQRVLGETGWTVYSAIANNTDQTAQQIFHIANTALRLLSIGKDWPQLEVEYTFPTVVDQEQYAWPDDFRKLSSESVFDTDEYHRIKGSTPVDQWNRHKYGLLGSVSHQRFRQGYTTAGAPVINLTPAPSSVNNLVALYYTDEYARSADGESQALYLADSDVPKIPEELVELSVKWRFRRAKGLDFSAELAEFNTQVSSQFAAYVALGDIPVGCTNVQEALTEGYVPDNGFGE